MQLLAECWGFFLFQAVPYTNENLMDVNFSYIAIFLRNKQIIIKMCLLTLNTQTLP